MEKFNDPNVLPKEMDFYTFEEFQKFMSVVDDIKFNALFETLYFCGLRRGELRGLSWDNINFEDKTLSIVKNVTNMCGDHGYWQITTPKARTSTRTLPMPDILVNDLCEAANEFYAQKEEDVGSEVMREFERVMLLRTVDKNWIDLGPAY